MTATVIFEERPVIVPSAEPYQYWRPSLERMDMPITNDGYTEVRNIRWYGENIRERWTEAWSNQEQQLYDRKPTKPDPTPQKLYEWE